LARIKRHDLLDAGEEVVDEGLQRNSNLGAFLGGTDLVKSLHDSQDVRDTLALDRPQKHLSILINLNFRRKDQNDKIGHAAHIQSANHIVLGGNVLHTLAESFDAHTGRSIGRNIRQDVNTLVDGSDSGSDVNIGGQWQDGDMAGSTILAGKYASGLRSFLVLQCLPLAGGVSAIEFRLELLVGCFTTAPLIAFNFACYRKILKN
jgi:hypothetical protein